MTTLVAKPKHEPSVADNLRRGQGTTDAQYPCAPANPPAGSHLADDTQFGIAPGSSLGGDHTCCDDQARSVAAELLFCAEFLDDVERIRLATENRLRSLTEAGISAEPYAQQAEAFQQLEHQAVLALQKAVRRHPLGPWIKATKGVGEKQGARLLAALGDVTYNHLEGRPRRGPAELWAYCGYAPGQKRTKGVKSNWNAAAKMRAFLIAQSCVKCMGSPYRVVYDKARESWADRDVKDGHKHNHALRLVAKALLKDLFLVARELEAPAQPFHEMEKAA